MGRPLLFAVLLAILVVVSDAQLTFSTGWGNGKRSVNTDFGNDPCTSEESLYVIYKLIQSEGERLISCRDGGKN
ncbi:unnamed protein product [Chilo suppressalis]|uniref:Adipokinetic hormone 2 n=1 Tax=Chilo suppressalis TaxID=168631 RepID=A0A0S1U082_CHISP|nr:adipokinetic hormone 2 precursor [Chilo suppressalis]RVE52578.1 hypothetical protein evm_002697 [Chilo suppressalis]CAH2986049.1 unnamed protein product [Chilo suppressalis]